MNQAPDIAKTALECIELLRTSVSPSCVDAVEFLQEHGLENYDRTVEVCKYCLRAGCLVKHNPCQMGQVIEASSKMTVEDLLRLGFEDWWCFREEPPIALPVFREDSRCLDGIVMVAPCESLLALFGAHKDGSIKEWRGSKTGSIWRLTTPTGRITITEMDIHRQPFRIVHETATALLNRIVLITEAE